MGLPGEPLRQGPSVLPPDMALVATAGQTSSPWAQVVSISSGLGLPRRRALHAPEGPRGPEGCRSACTSFCTAVSRLRVGADADVML